MIRLFFAASAREKREKLPATLLFDFHEKLEVELKFGALNQKR